MTIQNIRNLHGAMCDYYIQIMNEAYVVSDQSQTLDNVISINSLAKDMDLYLSIDFTDELIELLIKVDGLHEYIKLMKCLIKQSEIKNN